MDEIKNKKTIFSLEDIDFIKEEYHEFSKYQKELLEKWLRQLDDERKKFENEFSLNEISENASDGDSEVKKKKFELKNVSVPDRENKQVNFINLVIVAEKTKDGIVLKNITLDEVDDENQEVLLNWGNVIPSNPSVKDLDIIFQRADKMVMEKVSELELIAKERLGEQEKAKVHVNSENPDTTIAIVDENKDVNLDDFLEDLEEPIQEEEAEVLNQKNIEEPSLEDLEHSEPEQPEQYEKEIEETVKIQPIDDMSPDDILSLYENEEQEQEHEEKHEQVEPLSKDDKKKEELNSQFDIGEETPMEPIDVEIENIYSEPIQILPEDDDLESLDVFSENEEELKIADVSTEYPISASFIDENENNVSSDIELTFRDHLMILDNIRQQNSSLYNSYDVDGYQSAIALIEKKDDISEEIAEEQSVLVNNTNNKGLPSPSMVSPQ